MRSTGAWVAVAVLIAAIAWVYAPLLDAGFVFWDDRALFTDNADVRDFRGWAFFTDLSPGGYFPLTRLSLALDHLLFGYRAAASHAVNVGLHLLVVILVYRTARASFGLAKTEAGLVALLFALHPLAVEPVAWISGGRKDLLCALFYFLSLLGLAHGRPRAAALAAGSALLAKATAVTLVPWAWLERRRSFALFLLPFALAIGVVELVAQRTGLRVASEGDSPLGALGRVTTSVGFALTRLVYPRGLAVFYDRALFGFDVLDLLVLLAWAAAIGAVARRRDRSAARALAFFALALLPTLKLVPFGQDSAYNDRYLYLPSLGALVFWIRAVDLRGRWRALWLIPALVFGGAARARTRAWTSQETLWLAVESAYPGSRKVAPNLALNYLQEGENQKSLPWALRAVAEEPRDLEARSNLAVAYTRLGRLEDARLTLAEALALAPSNVVLLNNLGWVFLEAGDKAAAKRVFAEALRLAPDMTPAREGLGRANAP